MAKPDFSSDIQNLAHRTKQLRAMAADQKKEERSTSETSEKSEPQPASNSSLKSALRKNPKPTMSLTTQNEKPSLSGTVEQLIDYADPGRLANEDREWSRRLTYISTRIPEDMRESIDDLLFILKKEAKKDLEREPTLQDLASEAWGDLLAKYCDHLSG